MADLNTAITPAPVVQCVTKAGLPAIGFSGNVTMALSENPTGATLGGTLTVAAVAGEATFSNLTLNRSGKNFKLRATAASLRAVSSQAFSIPTRLAFTTQPTGSFPGGDMATVVVTARDSDDNTDT